MAVQAPPSKTAVTGKEAVNLGAPNQTLYVKNLNDKVNKNELRRALYILFSTYGPVLDIVTTRKGSKGQAMRGQAHIVFRDIQTSTQAMRSLQGSEFLGKELGIAYAKGQSQIIPKLRGTFEPPAGSNAAETTDLQKSIFNAPPSGIPTRPLENGIKPAEQPHGVKRPREEEEGDEESDQDDAPMEEDEDDAPMEEDDDD